MTAGSESAWWDGLDDAEAEANTAGVPPYPLGDARAMLVQPLWNDNDGEYRARPGETVLDIGCGLGRLTWEVYDTLMDEEASSRVVGLDVAPSLLARAAHHRGGPIYVLGDGYTLPFPPNQFDFAYAVTVFQHIPHDTKVSYLSEAWRVLRNGGVFVFTWTAGNEDTFLSHQIHGDDELAALVCMSHRPGGDWEFIGGASQPGVVDGWRWTILRKVVW